MTDRVYITTDITRDADYYHTHQNCPSTKENTLTEISRGHATRHSLQKCGMCRHTHEETGPKYGLAAELDDTDVDDIDALNQGGEA